MGFAKAASALLGGIAPRVTDTYTNAANATAGYARGLGDAVQAPVDQTIAAHNAFLTQTGAPTSALEHSAPIGNTAYGLEGYIPASTLQREGAAFSSAAQMLPSDALARGQQAASASLNDTTTISKLQSDLAKIAATRPQVYQQMLNTLSEMGYRQGELSLSAGRLNLAQQSLASENAYRGAELQQGQQRINISAASLNQRTLNQNRGYRIALQKLGISERSLQLKAAKAEVRKQGGGFTPDELVHIRGTAGSIAINTFSGIKDPKTGNYIKPPLNYKQAMRQEILHGIPPSIAAEALREAGYGPGVRGAPSAAAGNGLSIFQNIGGQFSTPFGAAASATESVAAQKIVGMAHQYLGTPYVWGGESPKGFDCSGFAEYLYAKAGISIPRTTGTQWTAKNGHSVPPNQLEPGDLVFFRGSDSVGGLPGHVGVYIGGGQMIDAPHTGASVRVESIQGFPGYMGARRFGSVPGVRELPARRGAGVPGAGYLPAAKGGVKVKNY